MGKVFGNRCLYGLVCIGIDIGSDEYKNDMLSQGESGSYMKLVLFPWERYLRSELSEIMGACVLTTLVHLWVMKLRGGTSLHGHACRTHADWLAWRDYNIASVHKGEFCQKKIFLILLNVDVYLWRAENFILLALSLVHELLYVYDRLAYSFITPD